MLIDTIYAFFTDLCTTLLSKQVGNFEFLNEVTSSDEPMVV